MHAVLSLNSKDDGIVTVLQAKDVVTTSKQPAVVLGDGSRCQSPVVSSSTPPPAAPTPQRNRVWKSVVGALLEAQKSNPSIAQNQQHEFPSSSRDLATVSGIPHAPVDVISSVDEASVSSSCLTHMADKSSVGADASFPVPSARKIRPLLTGDKNHLAAAFPGIQPVVKGVDAAVPAAPSASSDRQKQMKDLPPGNVVNAVSLEQPSESEMSSSHVPCQAIKSDGNMTPSGKPNQGVMTPVRKPGLVNMTPRSMTMSPMAMSMTPSGKPAFASSPMPPRTPRGSQVRFSSSVPDPGAGAFLIPGSGIRNG